MKSVLMASTVVVAQAHWNSSLRLGTAYSGVEFTHCGTGSTCGGHQTCSNYELALSDAYIWQSLGVGPMAGGYDTCPGGNWQDCCQGSTTGVCSNLPTCPLDGKDAKAYPVCVKAANGKQETAYVTGCCPSRHPCNVCKAETGDSGACRADRDQADLCDNLWQALGSPDQSTKLDITVGACGSAPPPAPAPGPSPVDKWNKRCLSCFDRTLCGQCSHCENHGSGYGCEKCWQCWDYDDGKPKKHDHECDVLDKKHDWDDEEVQCLSRSVAGDCRRCWEQFRQASSSGGDVPSYLRDQLLVVSEQQADLAKTLASLSNSVIV